MISSISVADLPALTVEELFVWVRRQPKWKSGFRPSLVTALKARTLAEGAFHVLHADDSVSIYLPADAARTKVVRRTYKAGSDYARDVWRAQHQKAR